MTDPPGNTDGVCEIHDWACSSDPRCQDHLEYYSLLYPMYFGTDYFCYFCARPVVFMREMPDRYQQEPAALRIDRPRGRYRGDVSPLSNTPGVHLRRDETQLSLDEIARLLESQGLRGSCRSTPQPQEQGLKDFSRVGNGGRVTNGYGPAQQNINNQGRQHGGNHRERRSATEHQRNDSRMDQSAETIGANGQEREGFSSRRG